MESKWAPLVAVFICMVLFSASQDLRYKRSSKWERANMIVLFVLLLVGLILG